MKFIALLAVLFVCVNALKESDPARGETILQPAGAIVGGTMMTPAANQMTASCNACPAATCTSACNSTCSSCQTTISACPSYCGGLVVVQQQQPTRPMIPAVVEAPNTCACYGQPSCGCSSTVTIMVEEKAEEKCGCVQLPVCACRPSYVTPEILNPPSCGCATCPCQQTMSACGCVGQPTCGCWTAPEIVDRAPCGCLGQPTCGCAPSVIVTTSSPCGCVGQPSCGCWTAPEIVDNTCPCATVMTITNCPCRR